MSCLRMFGRVKMVNGFEKFKEWFQGFEEQYVIIGGTACDLLISDLGGNFRATRDIDMVLIVEAITPAFGLRFWDFVRAAGYEHQNKGKNIPQYYRFSHPSSKEYPAMIELFSRRMDSISEGKDAVLTPLHIDEDISSLSAILLNDAYYHFMRSGIMLIDGTVPIIDAAHLIPFKMKAWLDLSRRRMNGEPVDSKNVSKHKNDVFRLVGYLTADKQVNVSSEIYQDIRSFCEAMERENIDMKQLGLRGMTKTVALSILNNMYLLVET